MWTLSLYPSPSKRQELKARVGAFTTWIVMGMVVGLLVLPASAGALTLSKAEALALSRANETKHYSAKGRALEAEAIAASQLPDPTIQLGALNLPTDSFSLSQEPMTQLQVGISQTFPKGQSLKYRYRRGHQKALAANFRAELEKIAILKQVRLLWNQMAFWQGSRQLLLKQAETFKHLKSVAASLYANNKVPQKDVLNAQLEISGIEERLLAVDQQLENTRTKFARWIGVAAASQMGSSDFIALRSHRQRRVLRQGLKRHPKMRIDAAMLAASREAIALARQDYLPGLSLGVSYGYRKNPDDVRIHRPDFLTGTVKVSLPFFPKNRQDKRLYAAEQKLTAAREKTQADLKALQEQLSKSVIDENKSRDRSALYRDKLIPEAKQYAASTLIAYQNNQSDFINVAESHIRWLAVELQALKERLDHHQANVNILYLQGK